MPALRATALLLLLAANATQAAEWPTEVASQMLVATDDSAQSGSGSGAPSTDNAGTGSTARTASPS